MTDEKQFYKDKNVLVAGGGGLVGQTLIRKLLAQGAYVRATQFTYRKIDLKNKKLEVIQCNLSNEDEARRAFKDMEVVFLAAARVRGAKQIKNDPSTIILYNLDLHAKLFRLAAQTGIWRCAHISSSYVYPDTGEPNIESDGFKSNPAKPIYGLGWFHRYLETLCTHFQNTSKTKFSIIRPTAYYGPYDNFNLDEAHVVPALIAKAVSRMDPFEVWGNGKDVRSFTYVEDVVDGLLVVTQKHAIADPINICSPEIHTVREVLETILKILGFHPKVTFDKTKPSTIPYKVSSPAQAEKLFGWKAKLSLEEGLKKTIDWYLAKQKVHIGQ